MCLLKELIEKKKKEIIKICGKNLVFKPLIKHIEESEDRLYTLLEVAVTLKDEDTLQVAAWAKLAGKFSKQYGTEVINYFSIDGLAEIKDATDYIKSMIELRNRGTIVAYSTPQFAISISVGYTLSLEIGTFINLINSLL